MNLQIRLVKCADGVHRAMLCDASGKALPRQARTTVSFSVNDVTRVTVEFVVDGENVHMSPEPGYL